jgi:hypothetical protein
MFSSSAKTVSKNAANDYTKPYPTKKCSSSSLP